MKIIIDKPMYVNKDAVCKHLGEGSKFLGSWAIKDRKGNWTGRPVDLFYNPNPPEPFTNTLVGYYTDILEYLFVCDGTSALSVVNMPCIIENDVVYISKYRHDFIETPEGRIIDGGRDYLRTNSASIENFLYFDDFSGNFYIANSKVHGYQLVTIEYEDTNVIDK